MPLTTTPAERRVGRFLHAGRPLFGEAFVGGGRHSLYGWLSHEDEVPALLSIVAAPAWERYRDVRVKAKARTRWSQHRDTTREWLESCVADGGDIFFSSTPLD